MNAYILLQGNKASCIYKSTEKAPSVIKYIAMNMKLVIEHTLHNYYKLTLPAQL